MQKTIAILSCIIFLASFSEVSAKSTKHKKKFHYAKTKKHRRHHGTGPDLKVLTLEASYKENPNNGITPIETTSIAK